MKKSPAKNLVLAVLAIPSGSAVLAVAGNLAGIVSVNPGIVWLVVFALVLIVPGFALLFSYLPKGQTMTRSVEAVTVRNNAPQIPDTLIIEGNQGEYFKPNKQVITPAVMRTLSQGIVEQGKGLSRSDWVGSVFTRAEYIAIRDELISEHVIEWAGLGRNAGLEITPKGERVFSFWHKVLSSETPPTLDKFGQGLRLSRLSNQPTNLPTYKNDEIEKRLQ